MPAPVAPPPVAAAPMTSKFGASIYGFSELDIIRDSTQSLSENAGNGIIAKKGTWAGDHSRLTFGLRNSRLGFKLKGPETADFKSSGVFEVDFAGAQANSPEGPFYSSAMIRARHYYLKVQTPFIDILAGQTWHLFGWQGAFHPNTVQIQGVPGELFNRTPQFRLSHTFTSDAVNVEVAAAASRPPQRNSGLPEGAGGIKAAINHWKGIRTGGAAGTSLDAAQIGVSGILRRYRMQEFSTAPKETVGINGWGVSADALLPVVGAESDKSGNALTLNASYVYSQGINDLYSGFNGGVTGSPTPTAPPVVAPATSGYTFDADPGAVAFTSDGTLHAIRWQSILVGAQYYLPVPSFLTRLWVSGNYSHISSSDIKKLNNTKLLEKTDWADGNLFVDLNPAVRFGLEYAWTRQTFLDDSKATNHRVQFSSFFIF